MSRRGEYQLSERQLHLSLIGVACLVLAAFVVGWVTRPFECKEYPSPGACTRACRDTVWDTDEYFKMACWHPDQELIAWGKTHVACVCRDGRADGGTSNEESK